MHRDPTAGIAAMNIEAQDRTAALVFRGAVAERVWIDAATARALVEVLHVRRDQTGELHGRLKTDAPDLLARIQGQELHEGSGNE